MTYHQSNGYIALIALLIVAAVGLSIGISVSLSGLDELRVTLAQTQAAEARAAARACAEEGLERLRRDFSSFSGALAVGPNSCILEVSVFGSAATVAATGTVTIYSQKVQVTVDSNLEVTNWQEE